MPTFRAVELATYCPRKLYYRRRDGPPDVPYRVGAVRELAFAYDEVLDEPPPGGTTDSDPLAKAPIEPSPATYRDRLRAVRDRLAGGAGPQGLSWDALVDPPRRDVHLAGRDCRGVAHKVLEEPLAPALCFAGRPPEQGVWEPQSARLVAAALALAWERERPVEVAVAEYPAHGVVRPIEVTARRRDVYRRALRTVRSMDGPPARVDNDDKCAPCEFADRCGVETRSLASIIDVG